MFEEKLSALQCADFDKAIEDLKARVEKIECKKHETVLHTIQVFCVQIFFAPQSTLNVLTYTRI